MAPLPVVLDGVDSKDTPHMPHGCRAVDVLFVCFAGGRLARGGWGYHTHLAYHVAQFQQASADGLKGVVLLYRSIVGASFAVACFQLDVILRASRDGDTPVTCSSGVDVTRAQLPMALAYCTVYLVLCAGKTWRCLVLRWQRL